MFVSIEGPDGVGKSTLIKNLKVRYPEALFIREPGTTSAGEKIRDILLHLKQDLNVTSEVLLFLASMSETSEKVMRPALNSGRLVFSDRWYFSTIAYQSYATDNHRVKDLIEDITDNSDILKPDHNIIILSSWETVKSRLLKRGTTDKLESRDLDYKKKVYDYYLKECPGIKISSEGSEDDTFSSFIDVFNELNFQHNTLNSST